MSRTELYKLGRAEVETRVIGEMVMERLRRLDAIAYIRFASVYRSYPDILAMRDEMDAILHSMKDGDGEQQPPARQPATPSAAHETE